MRGGARARRAAKRARLTSPPPPPSTPPFPVEGDDNGFAAVRAGVFTMHPSDWAEVSNEAKDLIRRILVLDPARRITAAQILQHPWLRADASAIANVHLGAAAAKLKKLVARRRLKKAMAAVRLTVRMKLTLAGGAARRARDAGLSEDAQQAAFFTAAAAAGPTREPESDLPESYIGARRKAPPPAAARPPPPKAQQPAQQATSYYY